MRNRHGRGVSVGTLITLVATALVVMVSIVVILRLHNPDATLPIGEALHGREDWTEAQAQAQDPAPTAAPTAGLLMQVTAVQPTQKPAERTVSVTFGGTVSIYGDVRRSCYHNGSKKYDFVELFDLAQDTFTGDLTFVTVENLTDGTKYNELMAPAAIFSGMKEAGITGVSLGFSRCLEKGNTSLLNTVTEARNAGLTAVGAYASEQDAAVSARIMDVNGVKVALLHYTDGLGSSTLKKLDKAGTAWLVSTTDDAEQEIAQARLLGADVVIVSMSWGKGTGTSTSSAMKKTAQKLADAGADLIVGTGTGAIQPAVTLTAADGRRVLCCYSLGYLMTEKNTDNGVTGMLLHVTWQVSASGAVAMTDASYTPTYIWRYKQDGDMHFRLLDSSATAPDGMDSTQQKNMGKALTRVSTRLGNASPLHRVGE